MMRLGFRSLPQRQGFRYQQMCNYPYPVSPTKFDHKNQPLAPTKEPKFHFEHPYPVAAPTKEPEFNFRPVDQKYFEHPYLKEPKFNFRQKNCEDPSTFDFRNADPSTYPFDFRHAHQKKWMKDLGIPPCKICFSENHYHISCPYKHRYPPGAPVNTDFVVISCSRCGKGPCPDSCPGNKRVVEKEALARLHLYNIPLLREKYLASRSTEEGVEDEC